ncbi:hypothetical protein BH23CHL2_BH23CHL2_28660 [soil metagenome]
MQQALFILGEIARQRRDEEINRKTHVGRGRPRRGR